MIQELENYILEITHKILQKKNKFASIKSSAITECIICIGSILLQITRFFMGWGGCVDTYLPNLSDESNAQTHLL